MGAADSLIGEGLAPSPYAEMRELARAAMCLLIESQFDIGGNWRTRRDELVARLERELA